MVTWHESDIEDYVCQNYEDLFGYRHYIFGRQVNIGVGIIDVLLYDVSTMELVVVEIKNKSVCNDALAQIMRYVVGVTDYCKEDKRLDDMVTGVKGILLGPDINGDTTSALRLVQNIIEFHEIEVGIVVESNPASFIRDKDNPNFKPEKFNEMVLNGVNQVDADHQPPEEGEEDG